MTWFSGHIINECVMFITSVAVWISVSGIPEPLVQSESTQPTANRIAKYPFNF